MIAREQVEQAIALLAQARQSTALARERWVQLCEARKALTDSILRVGFPASDAMRELERLLDEQARHYQRTLHNMERLCGACAKLGETLERVSAGQSAN